MKTWLLWLLVSLAAAADPILGHPLPKAPELRWVTPAGPRTAEGGAPLDWGTKTRTMTGKVVLIRYFTSGCSLCEGTLPGLRALRREFGPRGFELVGIYHPKPPGPVSPADLQAACQALSVDFPVAVDEDWKVLHRWWLDRGQGDYTSVSFLLDRQGIVRWLHPGGEYRPGGKVYRQLHERIAQLLR